MHWKKHASARLAVAARRPAMVTAATPSFRARREPNLIRIPFLPLGSIEPDGHPQSERHWLSVLLCGSEPHLAERRSCGGLERRVGLAGFHHRALDFRARSRVARNHDG